jgi:hypothetical protein
VVMVMVMVIVVVAVAKNSGSVDDVGCHSV